jgi:hypothetical protein
MTKASKMKKHKAEKKLQKALEDGKTSYVHGLAE